MVDFDTAYLKADTIDAVEHISEELFTRYLGLDFTIVRKTEGGNAVWFLIHDKDVFQAIEFQEFILLEILRDYLWPKKIYNIVFVFEEKK